MIEKKEIISGTEEELLEYFKKKYNLISVEGNSNVIPEKETPKPTELPKNTEKKPDEITSRQNYPQSSLFGNKVSEGYNGLFDGTSWGNK